MSAATTPLARALAWLARHPVATAGLALGAVALGAGGGVAAAGGVRPAPTGPRLDAGGHDDAVPLAYGRAKLALLAREWPRALGQATQRMALVVWPGVPPEAFMGFAANGGGATSNTALNPPRGVRNAFAELGWWGTEGGPRSTPDADAGPYPHPTSTANNTWLALHDDPLVVRLLGGRAAPMAPGAWQTDVDAQTAVGLVSLRRRLDSANRAAPAGVASADPTGAWAVALAFGGWSAGVGGLAAHLRRYATPLAAAPEDRRLAAWVAAVVADGRAGRYANARPAHATNAAYTLLRTLQKLEAGRQLATRTGGRVAWFPVVAAVDQLALTRAAYGRAAPT